MNKYNICMFAYNEEINIDKSVSSLFKQVSERLNKFYVIANGCTDRTAEILKEIKQNKFAKLEIIELKIGDKCNAWNHYMHNIEHNNVDVHFFVDADVQFSESCFDKLTDKLLSTPEQTVTIAGMPLSGRNKEFYEELVKKRGCFFGNLYGLKSSFITRIKDFPFRLPVGLNWIDSFLTKAVNTDLSFGKDNLPNRVCHLDGVGYSFEKLSPFSWREIKLYINRIARYELGKIQEKHLDATPCKEWPFHMNSINQKIFENFALETQALSFIKKRLVQKRLVKLLNKDN